MESLVGEIQSQLSVNAAALTSKVNRLNYGQTVGYVLYTILAIMGVRLMKRYLFGIVCIHGAIVDHTFLSFMLLHLSSEIVTTLGQGQKIVIRQYLSQGDNSVEY